MLWSLVLTDFIIHLFLSVILITAIGLFINASVAHSSQLLQLNQSLNKLSMEINPVRNLQHDQSLRVIQPSQVEPVVYRSNQSIVASYGSTQIPTIDQQITSSQSTLASYLPRSGISALNEIPSCHIHQVFEINDGE
jgi:hypothetical protein